jgi:small-conductance mechanosensitive channel
VAAYGTDELKEAEVASVFLEAVEEHENVSLDDAVRAYLKALEAWLDVYPEMRATEE